MKKSYATNSWYGVIRAVNSAKTSFLGTHEEQNELTRAQEAAIERKAAAKWRRETLGSVASLNKSSSRKKRSSLPNSTTNLLGFGEDKSKYWSYYYNSAFSDKELPGLEFDAQSQDNIEGRAASEQASYLQRSDGTFMDTSFNNLPTGCEAPKYWDTGNEDDTDQANSIYDHFGIKPRHMVVDDLSEASSWNSDLFRRSPNMDDRSRRASPTPRARRGAVIDGHKDMLVAHEKLNVSPTPRARRGAVIDGHKDMLVAHEKLK
uniref:Voltage-dependent N-type calcium channel subunit alpha-1B-like n=1 Tax=Phallusia mammillata TaxID=59560 RepID=A0A6F9D8Y9_9ASCI|nr:voltage-dependent N-type calcium channel subunit alpha-1B-like [Phallusia mammillata]